MNCKQLVSASLTTLLAASFCHADLVVYNDLPSWLSAVAGTPSLEDFEGATSDVLFGTGATTSPNGDLGLSANANFSDNAAIDVSPALYPGGAGINGNVVLSMNYLDNGSGSNSQETVTVTLPAGISAIAFEYNNYDSQGDGTVLSIAGTNAGVVTGFDSSGDGFFGLVDTDPNATISSFAFTADATVGDGFSAFNSFDDVRYGVAAIPEPAAPLALALVTSGLGMSLGRRRRATSGVGA